MVLSLIRTILGPNGRRLPVYGGASGAWMYGLLRDYYCNSQTNATEKHVRKCLAGQCKLSHVLTNHYRRTDGYNLKYVSMSSAASVRVTFSLWASPNADMP